MGKTFEHCETDWLCDFSGIMDDSSPTDHESDETMLVRIYARHNMFSVVSNKWFDRVLIFTNRRLALINISSFIRLLAGGALDMVGALPNLDVPAAAFDAVLGKLGEKKTDALAKVFHCEPDVLVKQMRARRFLQGQMSRRKLARQFDGVTFIRSRRGTVRISLHGRGIYRPLWAPPNQIAYHDIPFDNAFESIRQKLETARHGFLRHGFEVVADNNRMRLNRIKT